MKEEMARSATLSECERYRYRLYRSWDDGPFIAWLMFNPSTADSDVDDHTIRKCVGFARKWGYGGIVVVNLFAFRSTDPRAVASMPFDEAVGPNADQHILTSLATAGELICAWGCGAHMRNRTDRPKKLLRSIRRTYPSLPISCLGLAKDGHPRHPLTLPYETLKVPMEAV
jgi:hypothetical protein